MQALDRVRKLARDSASAARALLKIERKKVAYARLFFDATGSLSPDGARVLADLRRVCGIDKGGLVISPVSRMTDPVATGYRAGQRDIYLRVLKMLDLDGSAVKDDEQ